MSENRPKSTHSTLSHSTHRTEATPAPPAATTSKAHSNIPSHHQWNAYQGPVQFTGPSGLGDYRANINKSNFGMVGIGDTSREITSQIGYLSRTAPGEPFPKAKNGSVGEIGWPVDTFKIVHGI